MKINNFIYCLFLTLLLLIQTIRSEGFLPYTIVQTTSGYSSIQQIKTRDTIISYDNHSKQLQTGFVSHNTKSTSDHFIKIIIGDIEICCASDQKFYVHNHQEWIAADQLKITDLLTNDDGKAIAIDSIDHIKKNCVFYALSLEKNHTYYISPHNILVHNTVPVVVISIPVIVSTVTPIVETLLATAATFFGIQFFAKKIKHKQSGSNHDYSSSNNYGSYYPDPNDPDNDKDKKNAKEHPHGIYKDAPYHHKNSGGSKSQSPQNGQRCLDYSLPTETNQRVAIEGENFILLKYTSPGNYHGHVVTWRELDQGIRKILIKRGFVKKSGKIIRQITEKYLL